MRFDLWGSITYGQNLPYKGLRSHFYCRELKTYRAVLAWVEAKSTKSRKVLEGSSRFGRSCLLSAPHNNLYPLLVLSISVLLILRCSRAICWPGSSLAGREGRQDPPYDPFPRILP